ncbi:hypothetical protein J4E08_12955 [Sagittula sp. NFXS13]|uniref:hypothetical protein n=1 Tax=Sagittula sp. NFXS13 TaxID=2819095 RepID=UPI0032E03248
MVERTEVWVAIVEEDFCTTLKATLAQIGAGKRFLYDAEHHPRKASAYVPAVKKE